MATSSFEMIHTIDEWICVPVGLAKPWVEHILYLGLISVKFNSENLEMVQLAVSQCQFAVPRKH